MRDRTFLILVLIGGFLAGVAAESVLQLGSAFGLFLFLISAAAFAALRVAAPAAQGVAPRGPVLVFIASLLLAASLGVLRFDLGTSGIRDPILDRYLGRAVTLEGIIDGDPDERQHTVRLMFSVEKASVFSSSAVAGESVRARALVVTNRFPRYAYGDRLRIRGTPTAPKNFESDEGRAFNYVSYLRKDGIAYELFMPEIELIARGGGSAVRRALFGIKDAFLRSAGALIPEPEASLLAGILVGAKHSLGEDLLAEFRKTGTIHMVVLSGYNLTVVGEAIMKFFSYFLPRGASLLSGSLAIILFAIMTGASATVVRAAIMVLLVFLARAIGRPYAAPRALLVAGAVMVIHNPQILVFDPSFQLSFLATVGLVYLTPLIEPYLRRLPRLFKIREIAAATVATQLAVLPAILYMTGEFSLVALPVNLLLLTIVPFAMGAGFAAGVVGFFSALAASPAAFISLALLSYILGIVGFFAGVPFASVSVGLVPLSAVLIVYVVGSVLAVILRRRRLRYGNLSVSGEG